MTPENFLKTWKNILELQDEVVDAWKLSNVWEVNIATWTWGFSGSGQDNPRDIVLDSLIP